MLTLTASDLPRFMACKGFRLLTSVPAFYDDRVIADEGDAVHWLIEQVIKGVYNADELVDRKAPNGVFITGNMVEDSAQYIEDIKGYGEVEALTSYRGDTWEVRGRADHRGWEDGDTLVIDDFKYGFRIVEPQENWTLISHAIGTLSNPLYTLPKHVKFRIYQPRAFHPAGRVREWKITGEQLLIYWEQLRTALDSPSDVCTTSPHCYKCPKRANCPALQIAVANAIDVAHMAFDSEIDNQSLSMQLDTLSRAQEILKQTQEAYEELALHRLRSGGRIPEYLIIPTKGKTQWNDGLDADIIQLMTGIDVSKKEILTPTQAKKKGIPEKVLESFTHRPNTGLKLVRQSIHSMAIKLLGEK